MIQKINVLESSDFSVFNDEKANSRWTGTPLKKWNCNECFSEVSKHLFFCKKKSPEQEISDSVIWKPYGHLFYKAN